MSLQGNSCVVELPTSRHIVSTVMFEQTHERIWRACHSRKDEMQLDQSVVPDRRAATYTLGSNSKQTRAQASRSYMKYYPAPADTC